jgi:hypothetical protein
MLSFFSGHEEQTRREQMNWVKNDGGRAAAGYRGQTDDCTTRAIAIAAQLPYQEAYELVNRYGALERRSSKRRGGRSSARRGVYIPTIRKIMTDLGWTWTPTMRIGSGCKVHLRADELPKGRLVVSVSRHTTSVIDGVLHDTYDCSRHGARCVYGYFSHNGENSN